MISFFLPLPPRGQGRARSASVGGHARTYKAGVDRRHEQSLAALAEPYRPPQPLEGPVAVSITVLLPRPKSLCARSKRTGEPLQDPGRRPHVSRPDLDNLIKGVLDAMRLWWRDDAQVCSLRAAKDVAALDETPGYHVTVQEVRGE